MDFDIVVIGGGPGGYVASIRAAQLGFTVCCIDDFKYQGEYSLGGTCLNVGCIPSKSLLQSSENYHELNHSFLDHGISADNISIDISKMLNRKDEIISKNSNGVKFLFQKNKITSISGAASFVAHEADRWQLHVVGDELAQDVFADHVIIATGSKPRELSFLEVDNVNILDNVGALELGSVPKKLGIIGAGVIGLEMGSVWHRLGSKVTLFEGAKTFLSAVDSQVSQQLYKLLNREDFSILTGVSVSKVVKKTHSVSVEYGDTQEEFDKLIVAVGRVPVTDKLNVDAVGLEIDEHGFVVTNDFCHTNLQNVWAIGDCKHGPMLAHKASEEGVIVAERIAGQSSALDFNTVPWVIYTSPEVAWVGKTEQELQAEKIEYNKGVSHFMSNGRALSLGSNTGFIKVLSDCNTDRILGVHMIGPYVSELISEAVVAMEFRASSEDIAMIIHAHPSLSEVMHEAALACHKRQING